MTSRSAASGVEQEISTSQRRIADAIHHASHLLPAQGPIGVFIHHNTLHAFEDMSFDAAVREGSQVFGSAPYLPEDNYRADLARGRILFSELRSVLDADLGERGAEVIAGLCSRSHLRLAMLQHPLHDDAGPELEWLMAETDALSRVRPEVSELQKRTLITETRHWALRKLRGSLPGVERPTWINALLPRSPDDRIEDWSDARWETFTVSAIWESCSEGVRHATLPARSGRVSSRARDLLDAGADVDPDRLVHDVLIRFCSAFLDQGIAHWPLPERDRGFFHSFCSLHRTHVPGNPWWLDGLSSELARLQDSKTSPLASLQESLEDLGIGEEAFQDFVASTLLALRGWAGMIWHIEQRSDRAHHPVPMGSLIEFLAVRLILDRFALRAVARDVFRWEGELSELPGFLAQKLAAPARNLTKARAYITFQLAQILGWPPERLVALTPPDWQALVREIEEFDELARRRTFHLAYEHRFRARTLDALASRAGRSVRPSGRASFQAVFCIDEREESIRRHLEEAAPTCETFGAAGFFGVVMYYRGAASADFVPLCPVVVRPKHWVSETVDKRLQEEDRRRRITRRQLGMALQSFHGGSRRIVSGAFLSTALGLLTSIPLVARVVFPRLTARFRGFFGGFIAPPPLTRLNLERSCPESSPDEKAHGFLPSEMADIGERILRDIGLLRDFARIVLVFGHGSTSLNNPHESAHDCGACGGGVGGPNARAVAEILNDPRIRTVLRDRGIPIPADTVFVGGLHNTANDDLIFFDIDRVPKSHEFEFEVARKAVQEAAVRNAHERARRFGSAPLGISPGSAKRHMEGRAEDLSQVRPEWGHATNAICLVARRERTRGLFLDRRAFLVSYDPTLDDLEHSILARILGAVIPVCSGINLEYYFSRVDSPGWGCGSKLPHNITGLLGVMDGAMSDLRTGLPWQMVEIHEPVRLLFVIECTQDAFRSIMERNATIHKMVTRQWVLIALMEPTTHALTFWQNDTFQPYHSTAGPLPIAGTSKEWYTGWRDHLEFAEIAAAVPTES